MKKKNRKYKIDISKLRANINKIMIEVFWKIWLKFDKLNIHLKIEPTPAAFAQFEIYPDVWRFKPNFDFSKVTIIKLVDITHRNGRVGDTLIANHISKKFELLFEFCASEDYHKYVGRTRGYARYILYSALTEDIDVNTVHKIIAEVIKVWYESHLKADRDILIDHIKENYKLKETFTKL